MAPEAFDRRFEQWMRERFRVALAAVEPWDGRGPIQGAFVTALEALPSHLEAAPTSLPVLPPSEREEIEAWARGPSLPDAPAVPLHRQIAEVARKQPQAKALVCGDLNRALALGWKNPQMDMFAALTCQ